MTGLSNFNGSLINASGYLMPAFSPITPDFAYCNTDYGNDLSESYGSTVVDRLPQQGYPVSYIVDRPSEEFHLPLQLSFRNVILSVEVAGPVNARSIQLVPRTLRDIAAFLTEYCLSGGRGGFATLMFEDVIDFVTNPGNALDTTFPSSAAFVTVSLTGLLPGFPMPGDTDPLIAFKMEKALVAAWQKMSPAEFLKRDVLRTRVLTFELQASRMRRRSQLKWWNWDNALGNSSRTDKEVSSA